LLGYYFDPFKTGSQFLSLWLPVFSTYSEEVSILVWIIIAGDQVAVSSSLMMQKMNLKSLAFVIHK